MTDQKILIGRPSPAPKAEIVEELRRIALKVPGCNEAHLPQVFILGKMPEPSLVLVLVLKKPRLFKKSPEPDQVSTLVEKEIAEHLPGLSIGCWVFTQSEKLLPAVRGARCALF